MQKRYGDELTQEAERPPVCNAVLSALPAGEWNRLHGELALVDLPAGYMLAEAGERIEHIYLLESGFAGLLGAGPMPGGPVQLAMVGREGGTGLLEAVVGSRRAMATALMQVEGAAWRVRAEQLEAAMQSLPGLAGRLRGAVQGLLEHMMLLSSDNARGTLMQRCARWLSMADVRLDGREVRVTHDMLSGLLGVRRAGVTVATALLQAQGMIQTGRGRIKVLDAAGLLAVADARSAERD